MNATLHDLPELRQLTGVFEDRSHAGLILADMLKEFKDSDALVLAVPAGGVPVAVEIAAAYHFWNDIDESEVNRLLTQSHHNNS